MSTNWFIGVNVAGLSSSAQVLSTPSSAGPTSLTNISWVNFEAGSSGLDAVDLVDDVVVCTGDGAGNGVGVPCEGAGVCTGIVRVKAKSTINPLATLSEPRLHSSQGSANRGQFSPNFYISQVFTSCVGDHGGLGHVVQGPRVLKQQCFNKN